MIQEKLTNDNRAKAKVVDRRRKEQGEADDNMADGMRQKIKAKWGFVCKEWEYLSSSHRLLRSGCLASQSKLQHALQLIRDRLFV